MHEVKPGLNAMEYNTRADFMSAMREEVKNYDPKVNLVFAAESVPEYGITVVDSTLYSYVNADLLDLVGMGLNPIAWNRSDLFKM